MVYAIVTDIQDTFAIRKAAVKPLKGILLAAGLWHIDALMSLEDDTFEEALQAGELPRIDWSRTLEWHYRDT